MYQRYINTLQKYEPLGLLSGLTQLTLQQSQKLQHIFDENRGSESSSPIRVLMHEEKKTNRYCIYQNDTVQ